ncbi:MAG TPA: GAF domain-containing sensor histidine kinase [Candidatus Dormibacteraeota bacterium]|nr:GAF domain-containing sensor histidine kinase [Candidatus Dormibacteraeota bacterium]
MPLSLSLPLCLAVADPGVRRGAVEALYAQGYDLVLAESFADLVQRARDGVALAVVDPRLPDLGTPPLDRLRAASALHRVPLLVLDDAVRAALVGAGAAPALVRFMVEVHNQVAGRAMLTLLHRVGETLHADPALEATMAAVLRSVELALPFDTGTLFLHDERGTLEPRAAHGYTLGGDGRRSFQVGEGVVGWVVAHRAPTIVGDSDMDRRFDGSRDRSPRSLLAVPLMAGDRMLGALSLVRRAPAAPFTDTDLVLVASIGGGAAVALENARRYEQERALEARLTELDRMYATERALVAELQQNNRIYASVVRTVSHELKTPLFGIQGFARLLMDGHAQGDDVRDFATEIHDNATRLTEYADRVLAEDGLQRGRVTLDLGEVDLQPLVERVLRSLAAGAEPGRHVLVNDVPGGLAPIRGDHDKIFQIMVNLVGNAIKYSPAGGSVRVTAAATAETVEVVVEDEGVGVPLEERTRIFERFSRVTSAATRGISGTGIGLAIVRGLVELHGGGVWVDDAPVQGSRFHVRLPLAVPSSATPAPLIEVA